MSSQTAVTRAKHLFGVEKAGHTGTLDPLATGVLPILLGRAVKASEFMLTAEKHYRAELLLGVTTDTEDVTGKILTETDEIPCERTVTEAVYSFLGESFQTPPMYSALKVGGKKLCDLARAGVSVEREARPITVFSLSCTRKERNLYLLDVHCSKGTYIRTLCADIGKKLGCGGVMRSLLRTEASGFTLAEAHTLGEIAAMTEEERAALLCPTARVFEKYEKVSLPPFFAHLAHAGCEIYLHKIGVSAEVGKILSLYDEEGFFAVGEVREFDTGRAIKPIRLFRDEKKGERA